MKKIIQLLMMIMLIGCCHTYAQTPYFDETGYRSNIITPTEYIFEGTVLKNTIYKAANGRHYSKNVIEIHKIFRGNLKEGNVVILTSPCGSYYDSTTHKTEIIFSEDNICLGEKLTGIFFCNSAAIPPPIIFDNSLVNSNLLQIMDVIGYDFRSYTEYFAIISAGTFGQKVFNSIKGLYEYLLANPNTHLIDFDHKVFEKPNQQVPLNTMPSTPIKENPKWKEYLEIIKKKREKQTGSIDVGSHISRSGSNLNMNIRNYS